MGGIIEAVEHQVDAAEVRPFDDAEENAEKEAEANRGQ